MTGVIDKLAGVHPTLAEAIREVLVEMAAAGHPMMVTDGARTETDQRRLYAQGRTAPGAIVTYCNGVTTRSNHQPHADGYGHAVDCTFVDDAGKPRWVSADPWKLYGETLRKHGLLWGGNWRRADKPHAELPPQIERNA